MVNSLAWIEMRTTLAKLIFNYSMRALNMPEDWLEASAMHTLWRRPKVEVQLIPWKGNDELD